MRRVVALEFITLDGVIQAGGGPEEDTSGPLPMAGGQLNILTMLLEPS
jgi:hypothetical protein